MLLLPFGICFQTAFAMFPHSRLSNVSSRPTCFVKLFPTHNHSCFWFCFAHFHVRRSEFFLDFAQYENSLYYHYHYHYHYHYYYYMLLSYFVFVLANYTKPTRPCLYCANMVASSYYMHHFKSHADNGNQEVKEILSLSPKKQWQAVTRLRNEVIMRQNVELVNKGKMPIRNRNHYP